MFICLCLVAPIIPSAHPNNTELVTDDPPTTESVLATRDGSDSVSIGLFSIILTILLSVLLLVIVALLSVAYYYRNKTINVRYRAPTTGSLTGDSDWSTTSTL